MELTETFKDNASLSNWLDDNYWFQDGFCLECKQNKNDNSILVTLAYQIEGTYEAGTQRTLQVFLIKAENIIESTDFTEKDVILNHCMEGVDLDENTDNIKFVLSVPKQIEIECKKVTVTQKPNIVDTVEPSVSDTDIFITVKNKKLPSPNDWIKLFKKNGLDLGWRYYCGEFKKVESIPLKNYDGWYLQELAEINKTKYGLFFQHCEEKEGGFIIHLQRYELANAVWNTLLVTLLRFPSIEIHSGNCTFNNEKWQKHCKELKLL